MTNLDQWGIDIFKIAEMTNNRPLTAVTYTILQVSIEKLQESHIISFSSPIL